jgi:hypothetical protein
VSSEAWQRYQEDTAALFRDLGLDAQVGQTLTGVRTSHAVDVSVRGHHVGFETLWIVECKHWAKPVTKLHVLALREIVADLGADRGILMAESGFQAGSVEAAQLTNVTLTSLAQLRVDAGHDIQMMRVGELQDRVDGAQQRYWRMDKAFRIAHGLRPEVGSTGYSVAAVTTACHSILAAAARGRFPGEPDLATLVIFPDLLSRPFALSDAVAAVELAITEVESRLEAAEAAPGWPGNRPNDPADLPIQ